MKFTCIELENIFAYEGKVVLDVGEATKEKNIVLVWGRNGMGKTSLLNAIKLLFLGSENKKIRTIGFPPRVLGHRQYVLGDGVSWLGVINRRAIQQDPASMARVKVSWETESDTVTAERRWWKNGISYQEALEIFDGKSRVTADAAEERLHDFLPPDFVDLFFFDGEEIKALVEMAEGKKAVDFDRVLRTSFIAELADEMSRLVRERQRALLEADVKEQILTIETEINQLESIKRRAEKHIVGREEELIDLSRKYNQFLVRRDNLRSGASTEEREKYELRRDELKEKVKNSAKEICNLVPSVAPMVVNPALVSATLAELDQRLSHVDNSEDSIVPQIKKVLPMWLEKGPPRLKKKTRVKLVEVLNERLDELTKRTYPVSGLFANLDLGRTERVREELLRFTSPDQRRLHYQLLANTHRDRLELQQVNEVLMELEVGSEATITEYRMITETLEHVQDDINRINQDIGKQKSLLSDAESKLNKMRDEFKKLEKKSERAAADSWDVRYISRLARSLNDLREGLRKEKRERVMALINEKFQAIVHDFNFINKIELDETYTLRLIDRMGQPIGRSSLSSGIKQLVATSLLWAMKEVPGHQMPVIIDTPLGRIDRENQEHLLLNYYPKLAEQVIVLPTNAEINEDKYELIRDKVSKEYIIRNDTGDGASVNIGSLVRRRC